MHSTFGNDFTIKMRELLDQPDVLEESRTTKTGCQDIGVVRYGSAGCVSKAIGLRHLSTLTFSFVLKVNELTGRSGHFTAALLRVYLSFPLRAADDRAEVYLLEICILVGQYIRIHVAEGRLRLVLVAVVKGLDDLFFKVLGSRIC